MQWDREWKKEKKYTIYDFTWATYVFFLFFTASTLTQHHSKHMTNCLAAKMVFLLLSPFFHIAVFQFTQFLHTPFISPILAEGQHGSHGNRPEPDAQHWQLTWCDMRCSTEIYRSCQIAGQCFRKHYPSVLNHQSNESLFIFKKQDCQQCGGKDSNLSRKEK